MMISVTFDVDFVRGKARPRFARMGKGVKTYTTKETEQAEERIRIAYEGACLRVRGRVMAAPKHTPVTVIIVTQRPLPKKRPKRIVSEPDTYKPDIDNVVKLVLDALNGVAWADDAQVTKLQVFKQDRTRGGNEKTHVLVMWEESSGTE